MTKPSSCCPAVKSEITNTSLFSSSDLVNNGNKLDLDKSFSTGKHAGSLMTCTIKLGLWAVVVSTFVLGWIVDEDPHWFMAYISNWTSLYLCVYMTLSLVLSFLSKPPSSLVKTAWAMYPVATSHGLGVILMYWPTRLASPKDYDEKLSYAIVMSHGVTCLLVMIDGIFINHVPVRLNHFIFVALSGLAYVTWSIFQAVFEIDNPKPGLEAIYSVFDWWNAPVQAGLLSAVVVFLILPFFTILVWMISLYKRCDLVENEQYGVSAEKTSQSTGVVEGSLDDESLVLLDITEKISLSSGEKALNAEGENHDSKQFDIPRAVDIEQPNPSVQDKTSVA